VVNLLLTTVIPVFGFGQVYHFPSTYKSFDKTIDFGTVHGYLEIINDTGDTVSMKWISRRGHTCPPEWNFNFDDQNVFYGTVHHLDSAAFNMYPTGTFPQKMIIGLTHNGQEATGSIYFTIFPESDRADSTVLEFRFIIRHGSGGGNDTTDTTNDTLAVPGLPGNASYLLRWADEPAITPFQPLDAVVIYDLSGRVLDSRQRLLPGNDYRFHADTRAIIVETHIAHRTFTGKFARIP